MKREETEKGKCKYCGKKIDDSCIRCSTCDFAWQDGFCAGKEEIKQELKECFQTIKNIVID